MQGYFVIIALALLIFCVLYRARQMKKIGIKAFHFGEIDKKDFLIPPFVFIYFYLVIANTFNLPKIGAILTYSSVAAWIGAALCILAPALFLWEWFHSERAFELA